MKRRNILGAAVTALALAGALASPVQAIGSLPRDIQGTAIADIRGTVKAVSQPSVIISVKTISGDRLSSALRLFAGHDLTVATDANTIVKRDKASSTLAAVLAGDPVTVRARCTFSTANNITTTSCLALTLATTSPQPVTFSVSGTVNAVAPTSFTMTATKFDYDNRGKGVATALKAAQPFTVGVDSKTVVRLGDAVTTFASLAAGNLVHVHLSCQPQVPYNCRATRIDITAPRLAPVIMVGALTAVSTSAISVNVASVVPRDDDALDVQVLHNQTLTMTVPSGTLVRRGSTRVALSSLAIGTQVTVRARCQLVAPFVCVAERITAKA